MVFRGGAKAIRYRANITFNDEISTRPGRLFYLQIFLHFSTLFSLMNSLNQQFDSRLNKDALPLRHSNHPCLHVSLKMADKIISICQLHRTSCVSTNN